MSKLEEIAPRDHLEAKIKLLEGKLIISVNRVKKLEMALQEQVSFDIGDSCACCKESARIARKALKEIETKWSDI